MQQLLAAFSFSHAAYASFCESRHLRPYEPDSARAGRTASDLLGGYFGDARAGVATRADALRGGLMQSLRLVTDGALAACTQARGHLRGGVVRDDGGIAPVGGTRGEGPTNECASSSDPVIE